MTFALTDGGAVVREIHVEVVERAMVVDRLHLPATLLLKMPVGVMTKNSPPVASGPTTSSITSRSTATATSPTEFLQNQAYTV